MEKEINIAAILKDKPEGTKLYSPICGKCKLEYIEDSGCYPINVTSCNDEYAFDIHGRYSEEGDTVLFPSKAMRDWSKFAWKKGDIVGRKADGCIGIFDSFMNDDYATFRALYYYDAEDKNYLTKMTDLNTLDFEKVDEINAMDYIKNIEGLFGGKLNLSTLEIEKQPEFKDGDIVFVTDNHCYNAICIYKEISGNMLFYHAKIDADTLFLKPQNDSLTIEDRTIRIATEEDKQQLFDALAKENKVWNAETKTLEDLPKKCEFKPMEPMDLCLMRDFGETWKLCQFGFMEEVYATDNAPYNAVGGNWFNECIPYNDQTAHLLGTTEDWKGGKE